VNGLWNAQRQLPSKIGAAQALPPQLATALLHRSTSAPPARHQRATSQERAVQRATRPGKPQALRKRELGGAGRAARRASPCPQCRATPAHRLHLHGAEGELEERASGPLAVLKRAGALCQQALRSRALRQHATAPSRWLEARSRGAWWARCGGVVVGGGGRTGWRSAGRSGGGGYAKWRGAGAARAGKGLVRTLLGAVGTGVAENEEVE